MADTAIAIRTSRNQYLREYRAKNKESLAIKRRIWQKVNRETLRDNVRRWRTKPGVKEQENAKQVIYRAELKAKIYKHYGDKCRCCSESLMAFLSVDHINNDGNLEKRKGKRPGGRDLYNKIIREGYPDTYQILCMNCNHGKARNNGVCPHEGEK